MSNPWIVRLIILSVFLTLVKIAPGLAWMIVLGCCGYVALAVLAHMGKLPAPLAGMFSKNRVQAKPAKGAMLQLRERCQSAEEVAEFLKRRIIGQDTACERIARALHLRVSAPRKNKPLGVFCLAGPPGVGKTLFAKVLNELLFDESESTFLHVDMTQFANNPHAAGNLFGYPRGFAGSENYGHLTAMLRDSPNCIILLDEFEKAHADVHKRFLTAWNDGFVTEASNGAKVSTTGAIFILTTNAAAAEIQEIAERHQDDADEATKLTRAALKNAGFAPEVLSRIDGVYPFAPLRGMDVARVAALEILQFLHDHDLEVMDGGIDPQILFNSVIRYEKLGETVTIRDVVRFIEQELTEGVLEAKRAGARTIVLRDENGRLFVDVLDTRDESNQTNSVCLESEANPFLRA